MMTCEQFVYWVSGLLSSREYVDDSILVNNILKTIKTVINPQLQKISVFHTQDIS